MKKKILSLILALSMLAAFMPTMASASTKYGDYLYYEINTDNTVTITYCDKTATEIEIPAEIEGLPVTVIDEEAFYSCESLTSITIPDSVTSIGDGAFYDTAYYNDEANWENGVLYIGNHLIEAKDSKISSEYTIKSGTKTIADWAFGWCDSLTSITIPDSVTSIGDDAFAYCENLTSITIGNGVTSIGDYAFEVCTNLKNINVAENNKNYCSVDGSLFNKDKTELIQYAVGKDDNYYTIPDSVTAIGDGAFSSCKSLTSITIPDSVTSIGYRAFRYCESLTSITIPDSVTSIRSEVFSGCVSLTEITIPDSVTSIGVGAFYDTVYYNDEANWEDGVLYIGNHLIEAEADYYEISSEYTIKSGTKTIADGAFGDCRNLTSITIPDSVTSIGDYAFRYCDSLTSITIPNSVTSIGYRAFYSCKSLTSITIPDSVTTIGSSAFYNCSGLTSVTIPDSVTSIGGYAFAYCGDLTSITIPDSVTSIGVGAFSSCRSLTSITIPDSVTSIGDGAFWGCNNLTSITIPDSVTSIGEWAFYSCESLTSITIPDSVTTIGEYAFSSCGGLTSITIPDSVTSIGFGAFYDCDMLTDVYYSGTEEQWEAISIGDYNSGLLNATIHYSGVATPDPNKPTPPPISTPIPTPTPNPDVADTTPDTYEIGEIQPTETGVTFTVTTKGTVSGKQAVIVARYDEDGVFLGLQWQQITASDEAQTMNFEIDKSNTKTVKAFIWNALGYMMPASRPKSLEL